MSMQSPCRIWKLLMGISVRGDGRALDDGVVLIADALPKQSDVGGLVFDDGALEVVQVLEAVSVSLQGVGAHVQGAGVSPGDEPPKGRLGVRSDDGHNCVGAVGWVRHWWKCCPIGRPWRRLCLCKFGF